VYLADRPKFQIMPILKIDNLKAALSGNEFKTNFAIASTGAEHQSHHFKLNSTVKRIAFEFSKQQ